MWYQSKSIEEIYSSIIEYLKREDLHESNYLHFKKGMSKGFSKWEDQSFAMFQELDVLCQEEPEFVDNSIKSFFINTKLITNILRMGGKHQDPSTERIPYITLECIAIGYETAPMLSLPAYLLSKRRQPFRDLTKPLAILKHFHSFGLSKTDIDHMRKIRNSMDHEFTIRGKNLILNDGSEVSIKYCEQLLDKYSDITSWWLTSLFLLIVYIPRFGIILFSVFLKYAKKYEDEIQLYHKGIEFYFPDILEKSNERQRIKKEKRLQGRKDRTLLEKVKIYARKKRDIMLSSLGLIDERRFLSTNMVFFLRRISDYAEKYEHELLDMASKFTNEEDREWYSKGAAAMKITHNKVNEFIELAERRPHTFISKIRRPRRKAAPKKKASL